MKTFAKWLVLILVIAAAAGGGYWFGHRGAASGGDKDDEKAAAPEAKPVATVGVVTLHRGAIFEQFTAYGSVVAPPGEIRAVSVPFEARLTKVLVTAGQNVSAGEPIIEVEGSAATALAVEEARNAVDAADRDLQLVQQRYDQKLATNSDLFTAQNAAKSAQGKLRSLQQGGAAGPHQLKADAAGIVSKVDVQVGQIVPVGGPLVEVANENQIAVKLGVEPKDAELLQIGQSVAITAGDNKESSSITGKIRTISHRVDPTSRLVDVIVTPPPNSKLLLDSFASARVTRLSSSAEGLLAPRDSVLPEDDGSFTLFTVKDGHAVKHSVKIGVENDQEVLLQSEDLKEGDVIAVTGNHELEDGMAVQTEPATTQPGNSDSTSKEPADTESATTRPATSQPGLQTGGER